MKNIIVKAGEKKPKVLQDTIFLASYRDTILTETRHTDELQTSTLTGSTGLENTHTIPYKGEYGLGMLCTKSMYSGINKSEGNFSIDLNILGGDIKGMDEPILIVYDNNIPKIILSASNNSLKLSIGSNSTSITFSKFPLRTKVVITNDIAQLTVNSVSRFFNADLTSITNLTSFKLQLGSDNSSFKPIINNLTINRGITENNYDDYVTIPSLDYLRYRINGGDYNSASRLLNYKIDLDLNNYYLEKTNTYRSKENPNIVIVKEDMSSGSFSSGDKIILEGLLGEIYSPNTLDVQGTWSGVGSNKAIFTVASGVSNKPVANLSVTQTIYAPKQYIPVNLPFIQDVKVDGERFSNISIDNGLVSTAKLNDNYVQLVSFNHRLSSDKKVYELILNIQYDPAEESIEKLNSYSKENQERAGELLAQTPMYAIQANTYSEDDNNLRSLIINNILGKGDIGYLSNTQGSFYLEGISPKYIVRNPIAFVADDLTHETPYAGLASNSSNGISYYLIRGQLRRDKTTNQLKLVVLFQNINRKEMYFNSQYLNMFIRPLDIFIR